MSKTLVGLAPLALATVGLGALIAFLLNQDMFIGNWLFAAFLAGHGLIHIMFAVPRPASATATTNGTQYPFDASESWLVSNRTVDLGSLKAIVVALVVVTVVGYALAAMATLGLLVPASVWGLLVVGSTATSLMLLVISINPALAIGIAIDAALLWVALAGSWSPASSLI